MHADSLITLLLFAVVFLGVTALISSLAKAIQFPYTVLLLICGFLAQGANSITHGAFSLTLPTEVIYFLLLPLLLYEAAVHINVHQFRLQFKTITFLSTFGLLLSIATIAVSATVLAGLDFQTALLFGAIISATDPIAVLAIFKSLGAPKRLALLADGESMFNDATGVIAFRVVYAIVLGAQGFGAQDAAVSVASFFIVFVGSIGYGAILGYLVSLFIARVHNDRVVETTITVALAIGSFVSAEHFFHLSGVITTVVAAIIFGNFGRARISWQVSSFMEEFWEYIGFISLSLIFFFASYSVDFSSLLTSPWVTVAVIVAMLLGRAVSVYGTFFITNRSRFFSQEPNVPLSWQHVLNWGGLRGVIPLVLVYSLPDEFGQKDLLLELTLSAFFFTLFVNATTIDALLRRLGLHLPAREEQVIHLESELFFLEKVRAHLAEISDQTFQSSVLREVHKEISSREAEFQRKLMEVSTPLVFETALRLHAIQIERSSTEELFHAGHISERVFFDFDAELDLQQDAIEHPSLRTHIRTVRDDGTVDSSRAFRTRLLRSRELLGAFPLFSFLLQSRKEDLVLERMGVLQTRIHASTAVIDYLQLLKKHGHPAGHLDVSISRIVSEHEQLRLRNHYQLEDLARSFPRLYTEFERALVRSYAWGFRSSIHR